MKAKRLVVVLAVFMVGFATFSYADEIDQRVRHAIGRIERGIDSGSLTREEAHRLKRELHAIREDQARMKADGRLSRHERERLEKELDRLERHISRFKHNSDR
jgi:septal ring factor EnvC (AmiA/AmiB activator)